MAVADADAGAVYQITLTAAGVSVVLDATGGRLPVIVHRGAALPPMDANQAAAGHGGGSSADRFEQFGRRPAPGRADRASHGLDRPPRAVRVASRSALVAGVRGHVHPGGRRAGARLRLRRRGERRGPWTAFDKEHRQFLLSGDLVRMDGSQTRSTCMG